MGYRQTYFRINSQYQYDSCWPDEKAEAAFRAETRRLFQDAGWTLQPGNSSGVCDTVEKGKQDLYLHPMNFSGVILEEDIPGIEAMLARAVTFRCYAVDCYEAYLDLSDAEYRALLESRKTEIAAAIQEKYRTKRRNLYKVGEGMLGIVQRFTVHRLCDKEGRYDMAGLFVNQLFDEMIADGRLITAKTRQGLGVRTATDQERRIALVDQNYVQHLAG